MTPDEQRRYARQVILPDVGEEGQQRLSQARILVIGVGGLGCPAAQYLAAAGIGKLTLIDPDRVDISNLHRQVLFETSDVERPKVAAAKDALYDLNPDCEVDAHVDALTKENAASLIAAHDVVLDGCDDIQTRFLVADACAAAKRPLVSAAIHQYEGQLSVFMPYANEGLAVPVHPSYRDLYPQAPPEDAMPRCSEAGMFSPVGGILGSWQAAEALKLILDVGEPLSGWLIRFNALRGDVRRVKIPVSRAMP